MVVRLDFYCGSIHGNSQNLQWCSGTLDLWIKSRPWHAMLIFQPFEPSSQSPYCFLFSCFQKSWYIEKSVTANESYRKALLEKNIWKQMLTYLTKHAKTKISKGRKERHFKNIPTNSLILFFSKGGALSFLILEWYISSETNKMCLHFPF